MKFFAPQNNWDMKSSDSWWSMLGSIPTVAGVRVGKESALAFSAVFACTRIITETLASLPLNILEQEDARTTRKAIEHPLWPILHDAPNREQDSMAWFDMQTQFLVNWGNAYAEIQRDSLRNIIGLLPIHPCRIPTRNIQRNPRRPEAWQTIRAGQPGEIVYYVKNDDNTLMPIPASDMLHVPGVLSDDGLTGRSIIEWGANSIGIATATETHAGAFFNNGAVSNMAILSPKTVDKPTADRLREQWQKTFGGSKNAYKTLLLEDGMTVKEINLSPEATQLIEARKFGVLDICRFYRMQPHKVGDLSRAIQSNIESENISFVTDTLLPWVIRWEKAMFRQLLTAEEKKRYRFKFNMNALLRGDSATRAQFYQVGFNMGAFSPNDVREREDLNPIPGGDQYFIPGNNLIPLDKASELAEAQIAKLTAPPPAPQQTQPAPEEDDDIEDRMREVIAKVELRDTYDAEQVAIRQQRVQESEDRVRSALRTAIAARVTGLTEYEVRAIKQACRKPETFLTWQGEFYAEFRGKLTDALSPFAEAADGLGFAFSPREIADDYLSDSVTWLNPLADLPCDRLEPAALEELAKWDARPLRLARSIIPERVELCAA